MAGSTHLCDIIGYHCNLESEPPTFEQHDACRHAMQCQKPWFWTPSIRTAWGMPLCHAIPANTSWNGPWLGFGTPVFYGLRCLYYTLNLLNYRKDLFDVSMSLFLSMWASNQCVSGFYSVRTFDLKKKIIILVAHWNFTSKYRWINFVLWFD